MLDHAVAKGDQFNTNRNLLPKRTEDHKGMVGGLICFFVLCFVLRSLT